MGNRHASLDRVTAAIIDHAERRVVRIHSDGRGVARLELGQRVQRKSTYSAGSGVRRA
jgi:hypothetical protein